MTTSPSTIRILLVDDHAMVREGVRMLLEGQPDLALVGEAWDRDSTLEACARERPDLVLLDLDLGGVSGLELLREITALDPEARVLVFTGVRDVSLHRQAVLHGEPHRGQMRRAVAPQRRQLQAPALVGQGRDLGVAHADRVALAGHQPIASR